MNYIKRTAVALSFSVYYHPIFGCLGIFFDRPVDYYQIDKVFR